jgi:hypothetical protein
MLKLRIDEQLIMRTYARRPGQLAHDYAIAEVDGRGRMILVLHLGTFCSAVSELAASARTISNVAWREIQQPADFDPRPPRGGGVVPARAVAA